MLQRYLAVLKLLPRNLGMESSKSTPCCRRKLNGLLDGQSEGILDRRAGADKAYRDIVDSHYKARLYAGINISGINGEVIPVGIPSWSAVSIAAGDELWMARYILESFSQLTEDN
ncbi:glutamine synthetase nodule isozyme isoform X2 [Coffea arabica]|uniref:Glutamine synthetase nodule isozyme isoform X2 n=1 Tax=Coffea arabica TaxID=13443 RepID=A0ABM4U9F2_COFAR